MTADEIDALIRAGAARAQKAMGNLDASGQAELVRVYQEAARWIEAKILNSADGVGQVRLYQLEDLRQQVEARLRQLQAQRDQLLGDGLRTASELGVQPFQRVAVVDSLAAMRVPDEAVRFVRAFVGEDGLMLSDRLWRVDRTARDTVVNAIERAVVMGHGAAQAARELASQGQVVPADIQANMQASGAVAIGRETTRIMTGDKSGGGALAQSARVFRTEIVRAHGVAYLSQAEKTPGFVGIRFVLSPAHPKPDVCDVLASEDRFGLGKGVFPSVAEFMKVWPAHPNTLSYPEAVFGRV